jgi:hypothetical protein
LDYFKEAVWWLLKIELARLTSILEGCDSDVIEQLEFLRDEIEKELKKEEKLD